MYSCGDFELSYTFKHRYSPSRPAAFPVLTAHLLSAIRANSLRSDRALGGRNQCSQNNGILAKPADAIPEPEVAIYSYLTPHD